MESILILRQISQVPLIPDSRRSSMQRSFHTPFDEIWRTPNRFVIGLVDGADALDRRSSVIRPILTSSRV